MVMWPAKAFWKIILITILSHRAWGINQAVWERSRWLSHWKTTSWRVYSNYLAVNNQFSYIFFHRQASKSLYFPRYIIQHIYLRQNSHRPAVLHHDQRIAGLQRCHG